MLYLKTSSVVQSSDMQSVLKHCQTILVLGFFLTITFLGSVSFVSAQSDEEISVSASATSSLDGVALAAETSAQTAPLAAAYTIEPLTNQTVFNDFVVGPGKFELQLAPGESKTVELTVSNRMGETKRFKFEVEDTAGSADGSSAVVLLGDERGPYTLRDYISVPALEFDLEHGQKARIPVTVSLPADAEPGGRYGSIVVSTVTRDADLDPQNGALPSSAIISRIGSLFFITTPGGIAHAGELKSFSTAGSEKFFTSGPIDFTVVYENTGSVHVNPYGEIRIQTMFGEEVGFVELSPWFALPKSLRLREISWNRELLMGRYTATLKLNRGYDNVIDEATVTFYILPWKLIAGIFLALFILIFAVRFTFGRFELKRKQ